MEEQALSQEMPLPDGRDLALTEEAHSHSWHGVGAGAPGLKTTIQPLGPQTSLSFSPWTPALYPPWEDVCNSHICPKSLHGLGCVLRGKGEAEPQFQPALINMVLRGNQGVCLFSKWGPSE